MVLVYIHTLFLHAAHTTVFTRHTRSLLAVSKLPVENEKSTETFPLASASIPAPSHAIFAHVHAVHAVASHRPPGGKAQRRPPVNGLHSGSLGGINCENKVHGSDGRMRTLCTVVSGRCCLAWMHGSVPAPWQPATDSGSVAAPPTAAAGATSTPFSPSP